MFSKQDEQEFLNFFNRVSSPLERKAFSPHTVVKEVLRWTNFERELTEKICHLIIYESIPYIAKGKEKERVTELVQTRLINNWENQVAKEHLSKIRDTILNSNQRASLLRLYQQILPPEELSTDDDPEVLSWGGIPPDSSLEQRELLASGLVVKYEDKLRVANLIYEKVFNHDWLKQELNKTHTKLDNIREAANVPKVLAYLALVILSGSFLVFVFRLAFQLFFQPFVLPETGSSTQALTPEVCLELSNQISYALGTPTERLKVIENVKLLTGEPGKTLDEQCNRELGLNNRYNKLLHQYAQTLINASEFEKAVDTLCDITEEYQDVESVKSILMRWSSNNSSLPDDKREKIIQKVNDVRPSCPAINR
jgi:hypothetical protein